MTDWRNTLESLRNQFLDQSRSYPKLFSARMIGPIISEGTWRYIFGTKRFLTYSSRPSSADSFDQWCIYADAEADEVMCKHGLQQFDTLGERTVRALRDIPPDVLALLDIPSDTSNWLDVIDAIGAKPGFPDQIKGFQREQFKVLKSETDDAKPLLLPAIAFKSSPGAFPPEAFPHVWLAVLSPDVSTCSAAVIDAIIQRLPSPDSDFTISTWIDDQGCKTTWTVHDPDTLESLKEAYGDPVRMFKHEGHGVSGTSLITRLDSISPGSADAHRYHQCIAQILNRLLAPQLTGMKIEQEINEGRKRIDICFDNVAENGFFHDLKVAHQILCPVIFVECKNYSTDPANPELDQLQGRFGRQRGRFGILTCRDVADPEKLLKRRRDFVADKTEPEFIIVLTDADIKSLWNLRSLDNDEGFNQYLREKLKELIL